MRIVIDLQGAQTESRFRGIGRYSLSLTQAIAKQAGAHEIWLVVNAGLYETIPSLRDEFRNLIPEERIRVFDTPKYEGASPWRARAAEMIREHFIAALQPDIVLITSLFEGYWANAVTSVGALGLGGLTAIILYDLIPYLNPDSYLTTDELRDYYYRKIEWIKNTDLLLTISENSRQEAIDHLSLNPARVVNISTASSPRFKPQPESDAVIKPLLTRLGVTRKMVLYAPGGFDPRKNFERLIKAYSLLPSSLRTTHQLVIIGRLLDAQRLALTKLRKQFGLKNDELALPGYVNDDELISLYSAAALFVFPSLHEGFGLPVLEAMACGAPVIGANRTSIPEVIGRPEALFDPCSEKAIAEKMKQALTDDRFRQSLRTHGPEQARKFSWELCGQRALAALEHIVANKTKPKAGAVEVNGWTPLVEAIASIAPASAPTDQDLVAVARCIAFNSGSSGRRQFLLDVSTIVHSDAKSGIQRVVRSLLSELLMSPPPETAVRPIYFDGFLYRYADQFARSFTSRPVANTVDEPVDFFQDDLYLSLDLNMHLTASVHGLHTELLARGIKLYFIVYDIMLVQHPEWWSQENVDFFRKWLNNIAQIASGLICISEAVANEVRGWLADHPPGRAFGPAVRSFHLGADIENSLPTLGMPADAPQVLARLQASISFLMVGTLEPRKGHAQTLAAFEWLWSQGVEVNLVIVGKKGWLVDALTNRLANHTEWQRRLFWLDRVSDEYLQKIYAVSTGLIAASQAEGFGLPLIEAAQHQLPIIARDIPVFREVAGEHAYYFSGLDAGDLASAIREWIVLYRQEQHPKSAGMPWLTWAQSAESLKNILFDNAQRLENCR